RVQERSIVDGSRIALLDSRPERACINTVDILLALNDLLRMDIKGYERERMRPWLTSDVLQQRSQHLEFAPIEDGSTRIGRRHIQQNLDVQRIAAADGRGGATARLLGERLHRVRRQAYRQIPFAGGQFCLGLPV